MPPERNKTDTHTKRRHGRPHNGRRLLTVERVREALEQVGGIRTAAAHALGVNRATLYAFFREHPELKTVALDVEEQTKDLAEGQVLKALKAADMQTVRWYLDRKARDRGYGHRQEVTGPEGGAIPIEGRVTIDPSKLSTEALREIVAARQTDGSDAS